MNETIELLFGVLLRERKEKLSSDESYVRASEESAQAWKLFCRRYPKEVRRAALACIDTDLHVSAMEADFNFLLGLQMGLDLGRLDVLG